MKTTTWLPCFTRSAINPNSYDLYIAEFNHGDGKTKAEALEWAKTIREAEFKGYVPLKR